MKKIALAVVLSIAATAALAEGHSQPVMEPAMVEAATSSSNGGLVIPLLLILLLLAAIGGSGSYDYPT